MKLYGEFEEAGYRVRSYMPDSYNEPIEWYVKVTKQENGQEITVKELRIPMLYAPIFGPDIGDVANLEQETDTLIKELTKT